MVKNYDQVQATSLVILGSVTKETAACFCMIVPEEDLALFYMT